MRNAAVLYTLTARTQFVDSKYATKTISWVFDNFCQKINFEIAQQYEFHRNGMSLPVIKWLERHKVRKLSNNHYVLGATLDKN